MLLKASFAVLAPLQYQNVWGPLDQLDAVVSVPVDAAGLASDAVVDAGSDAPDELEGLELAVPLPEPPFLKSVTYQPDPFNWKPAAVTCLA